MAPAAPAAAFLFKDVLGGLGEGRDALGSALLKKGIVAGAGQLAVGEGQFAGLDEGDEPRGAEPEVGAPTADDDALDLASGSGRLDQQVQADAVGLKSGRSGMDEGGRERIVGMASSALGSTGHGSGFAYNIHSPVICGNGPDCTLRPDRRRSRV